MGGFILLVSTGRGGGFRVDRSTIVFLAVLVPSVILHEVSHGWVALVCGDDTAKRAGRLTLNPVAHIDPFGTLLLPMLLLLTGAPAFGYARPVPVNPARLNNPRQQSLLVSLAGPATNVVLALMVAGLLRGGTGAGLGREVLFNLGVVNVFLATFNLIPLPPLDGSAMVERLLPAAWWPGWLKLRQYSFPVLLLLVLFFPSVLSRLFLGAFHLWSNLL